MPGKAWIRKLDPQPAIYAGEIDHENISISVAGQERTITKDEWERLPPWDGPPPPGPLVDGIAKDLSKVSTEDLEQWREYALKGIEATGSYPSKKGELEADANRIRDYSGAAAAISEELERRKADRKQTDARS